MKRIEYALATLLLLCSCQEKIDYWMSDAATATMDRIVGEYALESAEWSEGRIDLNDDGISDPDFLTELSTAMGGRELRHLNVDMDETFAYKVRIVWECRVAQLYVYPNWRSEVWWEPYSLYEAFEIEADGTFPQSLTFPGREFEDDMGYKKQLYVFKDIVCEFKDFDVLSIKAETVFYDYSSESVQRGTVTYFFKCVSGKGKSPVAEPVEVSEIGIQERNCMKTNEDRMIDFVAKSYEENRFDPKKALARSQNGSLRRSLSLSKRTVMLKRIAGVAAAAAVGIFLYLSWLTSWTGYAAYDIAQTFTLPDSSSVTLAPGSTLRLQKHKDKRLVQMTGKVYFNVRHDDRAPFRVDAGSGFVKVLGTRFQVDSRDPISVSVVSGKVLFSAIRSGEEALILTKGQSAVLDPAASKPVEITPKHPNPAAWATGEFIYDNTPLPEVLSELSEYYDVTLVAFDAGHSSGESRRLSGEFSTSSLQEILNLINSALGTDIQIESQPTR